MTSRLLDDSGPLLAAADPRDQHHGRSLRELRRIEADSAEVLLFLPTLVESHTLIARRLGPTAGIRWLEDIQPGFAVVASGPEDLDEAVGMLRQFSNQSLSLFDAGLAVLARRLDPPVWTYDHQFDMMGVPVWR